ncbi:MAG: helix-turn-helix domain containing protein [Desulfovibrionaceae bacterium]|nr:helix-turn-helix domain containing protein [Desulfovibrionaceae bacterium]
MSESSIPYRISPQPDFAPQYERILAATGCRTCLQLAQVLDVKPAAVSDVKRRKAIPTHWLWRLLRKENINPDWIRSGIGDCRLRR